MEPLEEYKKPIESFLELDYLSPKKEIPFTKICCPSCDTHVHSDNLNINDKIAKCGTCHIVFPFQQDISSFTQVSQKIKQEILRPEGIELFYYKNELDISFDQPLVWFEWIIGSFFALIFFPVLAITIEEGFNIYAFLFFGIPMLLTALYFIWRSKHKIFLNIDRQHLNIQWRPNKLKKDKSYPIQDIHQLYVKKRKDVGYWDIKMIVDQGQGHKHIRLCSVNSVSKAKFLEQEIERHLGIQDIVVPEED